MKAKLPWMLTILLAIALAVVVLARPDQKGSSTVVPKSGEKKVLYWVDPMNPGNRSDKPGKAPDGMDLTPVYEEGAAPAASTVTGYSNVTLNAERQQLIGVQTGVAEMRSLGRSVRTVGRVAVDETRLVKISTKFDGYIEKLFVNVTGQQIRKGQPLFSVYSPDLLATQQDYLLAMRAAKASPSLLAASRQRLLLWDVSVADIRELQRSGTVRKSLTIHSPANGYVLNKIAVEGARVTPGEPLFEIANLDRVWIQADVYESELPFIQLGASATTTLSYVPGRIWTGRVTFIAPTVDPMTRTVKVRSEFDNPDGALKPEMFADVVIQQPVRRVVVVPDSAVLQTGTRSIVFLVKGDGKFEPREVIVGTKSEQFYEVRSGLKAGEKVVIQANFLIDSESRLKAALAAMSGPGGHQHGQ